MTELPRDAGPADDHLRQTARELVVVAHRSVVAAAGVYPHLYGSAEQRQAHLFVQLSRLLSDHAEAPDADLAAVARGLVDGLRETGLLRSTPGPGAGEAEGQ